MGDLTLGQGLGLGLGAGGLGLSIFSALNAQSAQDRNSRLLAQLASGESGAANALLETTAPLRLGVANTLADVLAGGRPSTMRVFAPQREALEAQFGNAREQLITNTPSRGGQLNQQLAELQNARASAISGQEADITNQALNLGGQIGFQAPGVALGGMGQAASGFGSLASLAAQQGIAAGQGIGSIAGIGTLLALKQPRSA